ncbi:MAG: hypothetical protein MK080_05600 [Opitutales bacterium]|nr:hypothetical protein [Opitutales bacterium]NRA27155.1 hypothetical protein [Opitutales bacterium]
MKDEIITELHEIKDDISKELGSSYANLDALLAKLPNIQKQILDIDHPTSVSEARPKGK